MLEKHLWNSFLLHLVVEILQFTDKHMKQSSGAVLSKEKMFLKVLQDSQKNIYSGVFFKMKLQAGNLKPSETVTGDVL